MKKNIFKDFFGICFIMFLSFSFIEIVSAKTFDVWKNQQDVFNQCTADKECLPLCIYSFDNDKNVGLIAYHYGDNPKWEIAFKGEKNKKNLYNVYFSFDDTLVHNDNIFDGYQDEREDWEKPEDWVNSELYMKLKDNFECPSRMYIQEYYNQLCFEGSSGHCTILNANTVFNEAYKDYSFVSEYSTVAFDAYLDIRDRFSDTQEQDNKEKIKFLSVIFPDEFKYLESSTADENAALNCTYLYEKADGKYQEYLQEIGKNNDAKKRWITNYLDPTLNTYAKNANVKYPYVYNYVTLEKLMGSKKIAILQAGNSEEKTDTVINMFGNAYNKNVKESINFISSYCTDKGAIAIDMRVDTDGDGVPDSDNMNDIIDSEGFEIRKFDVAKIFEPGIDEVEYDCGFLSDVAGIISTAYFVIEMVGLAILIIFTSMDYLKIFLNDNADELKKANSNFLKRLIIAVLLFLLPALVNFALRIFSVEGVNSDNPLCVRISNK